MVVDAIRFFDVACDWLWMGRRPLLGSISMLGRYLVEMAQVPYQLSELAWSKRFFISLQ
jgi:hypothetical protein